MQRLGIRQKRCATPHAHLKALMKFAPTEAIKGSLSNTRIWYTRTNPSDQLCLKHSIKFKLQLVVRFFNPKTAAEFKLLKKLITRTSNESRHSTSGVSQPPIPLYFRHPLITLRRYLCAPSVYFSLVPKHSSMFPTGPQCNATRCCKLFRN